MRKHCTLWYLALCRVTGWKCLNIIGIFMWEARALIFFQDQPMIISYSDFHIIYKCSSKFLTADCEGEREREREERACMQILIAFANKLHMERISDSVFQFQHLNWPWSSFQDLLPKSRLWGGWGRSCSEHCRTTRLAPCLMWGYIFFRCWHCRSNILDTCASLYLILPRSQRKKPQYVQLQLAVDN